MGAGVMVTIRYAGLSWEPLSDGGLTFVSAKQQQHTLNS